MTQAKGALGLQIINKTYLKSPLTDPNSFLKPTEARQARKGARRARELLEQPSANNIGEVHTESEGE